MIRSSVPFVLTLGGFLLLAEDAHAYLDPSSGAIIIQALLGGVLGLFVLVKVYWRRLKRALGFKPKEKAITSVQDAE